MSNFCKRIYRCQNFFMTSGILRTGGIGALSILNVRCYEFKGESETLERAIFSTQFVKVVIHICSPNVPLVFIRFPYGTSVLSGIKVLPGRITEIGQQLPKIAKKG